LPPKALSYGNSAIQSQFFAVHIFMQQASHHGQAFIDLNDACPHACHRIDLNYYTLCNLTYFFICRNALPAKELLAAVRYFYLARKHRWRNTKRRVGGLASNIFHIVKVTAW
jgi:hypothetical protein